MEEDLLKEGRWLGFPMSRSTNEVVLKNPKLYRKHSNLRQKTWNSESSRIMESSTHDIKSSAVRLILFLLFICTHPAYGLDSWRLGYAAAATKVETDLDMYLFNRRIQMFGSSISQMRPILFYDPVSSQRMYLQMEASERWRHVPEISKSFLEEFDDIHWRAVLACWKSMFQIFWIWEDWTTFKACRPYCGEDK